MINTIWHHQKEKEEGTLNSVSAQTVEGGVSEEEAVIKVQEILEYNRRKVVQMVYGNKGSSIVPRECKDLFWRSCKIAYYLYPCDGGDEYSFPQDVAKDMNAVIWEPL